MDAERFLTHNCNARCLVRMPDGSLRCRLPNYLEMSPDNTKEAFVKLPNNTDDECWKRLAKCGLANEPIDEETGDRNLFQSSLKVFHPERWVPAIRIGEPSISPVESQTFAVCRSQQNFQKLTSAGGCSKYCCKYITKVDDQNYIVVSMDKKKKGNLVTQSTFLHNTKISSSKMGEEEVKKSKRNNHHPHGRCISLTEMLHHMLRYPEMFTDLVFIAISTMPLELRIGGVSVDQETSPRDSHCITPLSTNTHRQIRYLPEWRKHTSNQITTYTDLKQSRVIIDKISQFSMRPPEFLNIIDMVGNYYRWFFIDMKDKVKGDDLEKNITINLNLSSGIDCLERKVKLR